MYIAEIATITRNGIVFMMQKYTCRCAIKEQWFSYPTYHGKTIPILYQPDDISTIIIGRTLEGDICRLVNISMYEGKRLTDYYEAMGCLKVARTKHGIDRSKFGPKEPRR